jgi:phage terminase large subunit
MIQVKTPSCMRFLYKPARYKVAWGGRAGVKSWSFAEALLVQGVESPLRIPCGRESMKSIAESVHQLLEDRINSLGLNDEYAVLRSEIRGRRIWPGGKFTKFTYHSLRDQSAHNIKSLEGADRFWAEEAQNISRKSWSMVVPTIRKPGSEIWVSFNPLLESDDTYQRFVVHPPPGCVPVKTSFRDNPFLSAEMKAEIEHLRLTNPDEYEHVYEGVCKLAVEGAVYKEQLIAAEKEGRITRVPYDAVRPVDTFWDLGFGDNVSIWFAQSIGFEFRLIDFVSDSLKDVSWYLRELAKRPYVYRTQFLPHDARAKTLAAAGRSVQQQVEAGGYKVRIVPNLSVADGIAAARAVFNRCWFDQEKCGDGIQALKHYKYEFDEALGTFKREPLHDWASHPADAFRYFAVSIREPERQRKEAEGPPVRVGIWS